jgi:hypothetical protein
MQVLGRELGLWTDAMDWVLTHAHKLPSQSREALLQELAALEAAPQFKPIHARPINLSVSSEDEQPPAISQAATVCPQLRAEDIDLWRPPPLHRKEEDAPQSPLSPQEMEYAGDGTPRSLEMPGPGAWIAATSARLLEICGQVICWTTPYGCSLQLP